MSRQTRSSAKLGALTKLIKRAANTLVVLQNYPDPDAIASAAALKTLITHLGDVPCTLCHGGTVGRAENRALVRYLDLSLRPVNGLELGRYDLVAMVDAQPGTGNTSLPAERLPDVVIDHHPIRRLTRSVPFTDVRGRYGATSTILYEYLSEAHLEPSLSLATALTYGIQSDTGDLGRKTTKADIHAFQSLYPLANPRALARIRRQPLPVTYFRVLATGLQNATLCGSVVTTFLGNIDNPDMAGEVADLLLRNELSTWALCGGCFDGRMLVSLRTVDSEVDAGKVMRRLVSRLGTGGGHYTMAGGQIPLKREDSRKTLHTWGLLVKRLRRAAGALDAPETPLI